MAHLSLKQIEKSFGDTDVLKGVSLDIEDGEFISLVGQSGCGKSTLLRIIAGLETQDAGDILIDGKPVNDTAPKHRNIAMVFQDYALYPHMTVAENIAMPLIMTRLPMHARLPLIRHLAPSHRRQKPEIDAHVASVAKQLHIDHLLTRRPAQLSGGQRQRVALGRALVRNPQIFLMDEPLSNLDAKLRVKVRREITELHASSGLTFVYVTHDQVEAMTMSDRVAMMQNGRLLQVGTPNALYADPATMDVARFIGSPEINMLDATIRDGALLFGDNRLPIDLHNTGKVHVGIRPEMLMIRNMPDLAYAEAHVNGITTRFETATVEDLGPEVLIHGRLTSQPDTDIRIRAQKSASYGTGARLAHNRHLDVIIDPSRLFLFDEGGKRLHPALEHAAIPMQLETAGAA